jgi:hypothetical protein
MFMAAKPTAPGTGVGLSLSATPSISSRFDAGSVLTSRTDLPASDNDSATAQAREVLPTPPLPVKNRFRIGRVMRLRRREGEASVIRIPNLSNRVFAKAGEHTELRAGII